MSTISVVEESWRIDGGRSGTKLCVRLVLLQDVVQRLCPLEDWVVLQSLRERCVVSGCLF